MIEHVASAQLMPLGAYEDPANTTSEMAWGRPTVCVLPNGNTFVSVWVVKNWHEVTDPVESNLTVRCWLLDPDLAVLDVINVQGAHPEGANSDGGIRPTAYRVEDHTVWLIISGNSYHLDIAGYVWHEQVVVINAKGDTLDVIDTIDLGAAHVNGPLYNVIDGNPGVVYFPEFNIVCVCAGDILTFKNGTLLSTLPAASFNGMFGYGIAVFRDPDDPTRFGTVIADSTWVDPNSIGTSTRYIYTLNPTTGAVTETEEVIGTGIIPDPGLDWYTWQQTNTSPFEEDIYFLNSTDMDPGTSQVMQVVNARTFEFVASEFEEYDNAVGAGYISLYDDSPAMQVGAKSGAQIAWVYLDAYTTDHLGLRVTYIDANVNPPRYEWVLLRMPFETALGDKKWDTFAEGNSAMDYFDGTCVFAGSVLDISQFIPDYGVGRADYSTIVVFKFAMGEKSPMRLDTGSGYVRALGGMPAGGGQMKLQTPGGIHHEWSTEDDVDDYTKLRYPLRLKSAADRLSVVAMMTPDP